MDWLKDSLVDIIVTIIIITAVIAESPWINGVVWGYTGILLFAKAIILFGDNALNLLNKTKTDAPLWFSHLLYGTNTVVLMVFTWWYTGVAWAAIWTLSYLAQRKLEQRKSPA